MKIIQVPMAEEEARELTAVAQRMNTSRADLIRTACRSYLRRLEEERLDQIYETGYREFPEDPAWGVATANLLAGRLAGEDWTE